MFLIAAPFAVVALVASCSSARCRCAPPSSATTSWSQRRAEASASVGARCCGIRTPAPVTTTAGLPPTVAKPGERRRRQQPEQPEHAQGGYQPRRDQRADQRRGHHHAVRQPQHAGAAAVGHGLLDGLGDRALHVHRRRPPRPPAAAALDPTAASAAAAQRLRRAAAPQRARANAVAAEAATARRRQRPDAEHPGGRARSRVAAAPGRAPGDRSSPISSASPKFRSTRDPDRTDRDRRRPQRGERPHGRPGAPLAHGSRRGSRTPATSRVAATVATTATAVPPRDGRSGTSSSPPIAGPTTKDAASIVPGRRRPSPARPGGPGIAAARAG